VTLNLQIIVTFFFDIAVADVNFSGVELSGCALLLLANAYLFLSDYYVNQRAAGEQSADEKTLKTEEADANADGAVQSTAASRR